MRAELLLRAGAELAEGPLSLTDGTLAWVDILRGEIHRLDRVDGSRRVTYVGEPVVSIVEATDGLLIAACRSGLRHLGDDEVLSPLLAALPDRGPDLRMNDGKADPAGRVVGGTMTLGTPRPGRSLWSFGPDGPIELVNGVTVSTGLAWSTDGETLFLIDTPSRRVDAFDDDAGTGSAVRRYEDGGLDAVIEVPTPYVPCPVFTGRELDELVMITTASQPFGDEAPAGAGDLYLVRPGVAGQPAHRVDLEMVTASSLHKKTSVPSVSRTPPT